MFYVAAEYFCAVVLHEIEGSAEKAAVRKFYSLWDWFRRRPQCRGFRPVDSEAFFYKNCCDLWETVDEVIRSSTEAHVINVGA